MRVDDATGTVTTISLGDLFESPHGVTVGLDGTVVVTDLHAGVIQVNAVTGQQSLISIGGLLDEPTNSVLNGSGYLFVVDGAFGGLIGELVRIDLLTGEQSLVTSGGHLTRPHDLTLDANGNILIVDFDGRVVRVDPLTGQQTLVSSGLAARGLGEFCFASGIAVEADGGILVADACGPSGGHVNGSVIRVDPITGMQTIVSLEGMFVDPFDVAVVNPIPEPSTASLLALGLVGLAAQRRRSN
jgi:streptogramin lyase